MAENSIKLEQRQMEELSERELKEVSGGVELLVCTAIIGVLSTMVATYQAAMMKQLLTVSIVKNVLR